MSNENKNLTDASLLREKAEGRMGKKRILKNTAIPETNVPALVHELEVHKIEQEMQNVELRLSRDNAERAAAKYADLYREIYDFSPAGYFNLNREGTVIGLNLSGAALLGKDRSALINGTLRIFISRDTLALFDNFLIKVFEANAKQICEVKLVTKKNHEIFVHMEGVFLENENKCLLTAIDITGRKKAENALKFANAYNRSLIEASLDPLMTIGHDGKIIDVNVATENVTGLKREALIGTDFTDYFTDSDKARAAHEAVFNQGWVRDYPLEIRHIDGHTIHVLYNAVLYRDTAGNVIGVFAAARDITDRKKAEDALKENLEYLEAVINTVQEGITLSDWDGNFEIFNKRMEEITGYKKDEANRTKSFISKIYPPSEQQIKVAETINKLLLEGGVNYEETRIISKTRMIKYVSVATTVLKRNNKPYILSAYHDITERRQAEELLKDEYNFRTAIENSMQAGVSVVSMEGKQFYVNPCFCEMTGWTSQELVGKSSPFIYWPINEIDNINNAFKMTLSGDAAPSGFELKFIRKNGELFDVLVNISLLKNSQNEAIGWLAVVSDITDRKFIEESLRKSETLLRETQRISKIGGWEYDVRSGSSTFTEGFFDIYGAAISDIEEGFAYFHPDDVEMVKEEFEKSISDNLFYDIEARFIDSHGKNLWVRCIGNPVASEGKVIRILGSLIDITERKQTESIIQNLLHEKEIILREVHHRIKNNMCTISNLLLIQSETQDNPVTKNVLESAAGRVQSMQILYNKLYCSENTKEISIKDYLPSLLEEIAGVYNLRGLIKINTHFDDIVLDAKIISSLGIILNELITNSMKYAFPNRKEGVISIKAFKNEDRVHINFEDNGVGIPESITCDHSCGFGMQLVGMLVSQIGGNIAIERNNGTKFNLEFDLL